MKELFHILKRSIHPENPINPSELLIVTQQDAEAAVQALELMGGRTALNESAIHRRANPYPFLPWASEAWGFRIHVGNGAVYVKQGSSKNKQEEYITGQLAGQQLFREVGFGHFAPYTYVEGSLSQYLVQKIVPGAPMRDKQLIQSIIRPYGLSIADPSGNTMFTPDFGPIFIDFNHVSKIS